MVTFLSNLITGAIDRLVRWVIVPVTGVIPRLASSGALLVVFAGAWLAFGLALVANPGALDAVWRALGQLPLPIQAIAWLVFLPVLAGLWVWQTDWPIVVRLGVIAGLAGWNLLVFLPHRSEPGRAAVGPEGLRPSVPAIEAAEGSR